MQRRFRKVCTSLKERSFMSYAKFVAVGGFSDMNIIIIKATTPDDVPLQEKYIQQLLKLFSISPTTCNSFAVSFTRRFGTTRSWRVALKCLILLHRLLRSVPGKSTLWNELLWTRSNALISLHPCHFRDESSSCPVSFTNFVTSYAHLLDEALNCVAFDDNTMEGQEVDEKEEPTAATESFQEKMKGLSEMLEILPQLQSLIDRVMQCYPVGVASRSFIVQCAMKLILRDSFVCYTKFRREIVGVLDNLLEMPYRNCIAAFNIYKKAAVQTNELYEFYEWCKVKGMCGLYEYPSVEPIPYIQIKALESFLSGMWQLTESSSPITSHSSSSAASPSDFTERQVVTRRDTDDIKGKVIEAEEKPLIEPEIEDDENHSWETLLESSVSFSHAYQRDLCSSFYQLGWEGGYGIEQHSFNAKEDHKHEHAYDTMNIAVLKSPTATHNPFSELYCCSPQV